MQREIRHALNISKSQLQRYISDLIELEYIQQMGGYQNRGYKYKILWWDDIAKLRIYQGLQEQELAQLETPHLQLDKGKLYVPSTKRANKRMFDLKPFQILPLHEYLLTDRKSLNDKIEGNYLFHKKRLIRGMSRIKAMIKRYEPRLTNMAQIRASTITNWLKHYNLREVQYMAEPQIRKQQRTL